MLQNEEMKKCDVEESSEEKEVETRKTSGEENVGAKKTFEKEDIETEKDSGEEKFDYKNIYKKKEASLKDDTKLAAPSEALPAPVAENAQNELAHVLAPLEAQAENTDLEPHFPKRNCRVSKPYPENELEMKEHSLPSKPCTQKIIVTASKESSRISVKHAKT